MPKKIIFAQSGGNPLDSNSWSGTPYSIYKQLIKYYSVETNPIMANLLTYVVLGLEYVFSKLTHKNFIHFSNICARSFSRRLARKVKKIDNADVLFIIGADCLSDLKLNIPIIYLTDATFTLMVDYYWHNLPEYKIKMGNRIQHDAFENSSISIVSSNWAKNSAIVDYGISNEKIRVIKFGPNHTSDYTPDVKPTSSKKIRLLFVGKDWKRKGLDVAISCTNDLNKRNSGLRYHLDVVGCSDSGYQSTEDITIHGFIDDNKVNELFSQAHLFILPTRAECSGIVFCEAAFYGIPAIAYDTGGLRDYVINSKNGYTLPLTADYKKFADLIQQIMSDPSEYYKLSKGACELYDSELNWNCWMNQAHEIIEELTNRNKY